MALLDFAGMIGIIEEYAYLVLGVAAIYYLFLTFKGGTEGEHHRTAWGAGSGILSGIKKAAPLLGSDAGSKRKDQNKEKKKNKKLRRAEMAEMRDYHEAKKDLKEIDEAKTKLDGFMTDVNVLKSITPVTTPITDKQRKDLVKKFKDFKKHVDDVENAENTLHRWDFKSFFRTQALIKLLEDDDDVKSKKVNQIAVLLRLTAKQHTAAKKEFDEVVEAVKKTGGLGKLVETINTATFPMALNVNIGTPPKQLVNFFGDVETKTSDLKTVMDDVESKQKTAFKTLQGLIADLDKI
jgi:hypothetical protein